MRRAIRENVHVSQRRLGQDLGVTGTAIANWESGRREPRGELLVRYAELLGALAEVSR
jgi:transcriptional regulator with XRE-family HTH domain